MSYDSWKSTNPAAEQLGPEPGPERPTRCLDCGWMLPRFGCPYEGCNGVALHTKKVAP
jgi:hypothetical protein